MSFEGSMMYNYLFLHHELIISNRGVRIEIHELDGVAFQSPSPPQELVAIDGDADGRE